MSQVSLCEGVVGELQFVGVFDYSSGLVLCEQGGWLICVSQVVELVVDCLVVECFSSVGIFLLLVFMCDVCKVGKVLSVRVLLEDMWEIVKVSSFLEILFLQE